MAIVMILTQSGVSLDDYELVRKETDFESDPPKGGVVHVCTHDGSMLRITDVWESAEDFQAFADNRMIPGMQKAGIDSPPQVEIYPLHNLFTPGV